MTSSIERHYENAQAIEARKNRDVREGETRLLAALTSDAYALGFNDGLTHPEPRDSGAEYVEGYVAGWLGRHGRHTGRMVEVRVENGVARRRYECRACGVEVRT